MSIKYSDLPQFQQSKSIKDQIIACLLEKGGLLTAHEIIKILQNRNVLPSGSDNAYTKAKRLLYHHCRESYYLQREKGDIIRLLPQGKDDSRLWSNPLDAPDITAFIFSLLVMERARDLTYRNAVPWIREYIGNYENEYHTDCPGKGILTKVNGENLYYTVKKQVKYFLQAKGIV
jgi:hypothetical protein